MALFNLVFAPISTLLKSPPVANNFKVSHIDINKVTITAVGDLKILSLCSEKGILWKQRMQQRSETRVCNFFWARLASFGHLGLISDPLIVLKLKFSFNLFIFHTTITAK